MISLKDILTDLAKAIVDNPDQVVVNEQTDNDGSVLLILTVAPEDMGMVIGRHGKIAKAIRTVMKAAAVIADVHVRVDILDQDEITSENVSES